MEQTKESISLHTFLSKICYRVAGDICYFCCDSCNLTDIKGVKTGPKKVKIVFHHRLLAILRVLPDDVVARARKSLEYRSC